MPKMSADQFIHFSEEPLPAFTRSVTSSLGSESKPLGALWACKKLAWYRWCTEERFELQCLKSYNLLQIDMSRILCVYDEDQLFAFARKYSSEGWSESFSVRWDDVRADGFAGFHISNRLVRKFRMHSSMGWLYGFDVGSICVWEPVRVLVSCPV
jgi:hypothetical protein